LTELISEGRAALIGPIRQELLSGVKAHSQFKLLRDHLRSFPNLELTVEDYEEAAHGFNLCRARGIQGSNTDLLICAAAIRRKMPILTADGDFQDYAQALPISLHAPR
jgi:predicted nucleic acid-binding protein